MAAKERGKGWLVPPRMETVWFCGATLYELYRFSQLSHSIHVLIYENDALTLHDTRKISLKPMCGQTITQKTRLGAIRRTPMTERRALDSPFVVQMARAPSLSSLAQYNQYTFIHHTIAEGDDIQGE
ncbi:hypothetical protein Y032_0086g1984 [Ancylostoma ceylanicum]|uniref:Uncharacterized protein n=1 Tax=Ancylostoma ceylanicum TaxID=53326 RepID=A0A016TP28_9BILA|nr:hypothetical protein Y032_0086g1984 [Ancylostoma ceylanicum]